MFDDDGYVEEGRWGKLQGDLNVGKSIQGEAAMLFLADRFASETHGNYSTQLLYSRANVLDKFDVIVRRKAV